MKQFPFVHRLKEEVTIVNNHDLLALYFRSEEPGAWISVTMVIVKLFFQLL